MNENHDRSISSAIRKLAGTYRGQRVTIVSGECLSVDKSKRTCVVLVDNSVELPVKLMEQVGDGVLFIPEIGSTVGVVYCTYEDARAIMFSDLDSISFKGDELGGLVKVVSLTEKLNAIEKDINDLKTLIQNWVVAPGDGGLALKTALATWFGKQLTETVRIDIENINVKHGE